MPPPAELSDDSHSDLESPEGRLSGRHATGGGGPRRAGPPGPEQGRANPSPLLPLSQAEQVVDSLNRVFAVQLEPRRRAGQLLVALQEALGREYDCELALMDELRGREAPRLCRNVTVGPTFEAMRDRPDSVLHRILGAGEPAVRAIVPKALQQLKTPRVLHIGREFAGEQWLDRMREQVLAPHGWKDLIVGVWASSPDHLVGVAVMQRKGLPPLGEEHKPLVALMLRAAAPMVDAEVFGESAPVRRRKRSGKEPHRTSHVARPADWQRIASLSGRQRDVLGLLVRGMSEKQVAQELGLSAHTVHTHVKALYGDLDVSSRGELLAMFIDQRVMVPRIERAGSGRSE